MGLGGMKNGDSMQRVTNYEEQREALGGRTVKIEEKKTQASELTDYTSQVYQCLTFCTSVSSPRKQR